MSLKGFGTFTNSKIVSRKILSDSVGNLGTDEPGNYVNKISLKSNTKAAINPTTDNDDMAGVGRSEGYGVSIGAGASGDKAIGYSWQGAGVASLNGAQGN